MSVAHGRMYIIFFPNDNSEWYGLMKIAYQSLATLSLFKTSFSTAALLEMFLTYSSAWGKIPEIVLCKLCSAKWTFSINGSPLDNLGSFLIAFKVAFISVSAVFPTDIMGRVYSSHRLCQQKMKSTLPIVILLYGLVVY